MANLSCRTALIIFKESRLYSKTPKCYRGNGNTLQKEIQCISKVYLQIRTCSMSARVSEAGNRNKNIGPMGWFLLAIPVSTFLLGTWQVKRRKWKLKLIDELRSKTTAEPIALPEAIEELKDMEYRPVKVRGTFLHDRELLMGPRSFIADQGQTRESSVFSASQGQVGWLVITPFQLSDRNLTILVNRGWVPSKFKHAETRMEGQIDGEVELIGIVRAHEQRGPFMPRNNLRSNSWFYRNLDEMSHVTGSDPIYIDAKSSSTVKGGPIGGQTYVSLRNEHLSYIFTWYTLSAVTGYLWHRLYILRKPLL
ncbi:surfeit locus protein 1 [Ischnura elegans]|uniref:surfeit locus protein 1 n=1 Tax=Ischnura elegans TaxID=197161 RepID=UPI001ED890FD|nr:surfeit locus protein 1 [Ischnura elegans]